MGDSLNEAPVITPSFPTTTPEVSAASVLEAGRCVLAEVDGVESLSKKQVRKLIGKKLDVDPAVIKASSELEAALLKAIELKIGAKLSEEEEAEAVSEAEAPSEALLRGRVTIAEGSATWQGSWTFSKKDWEDKKKRRKFRLTAEKFELGQEAKFKGFFKCGKESTQKQEKDVATLTFSKDGDVYAVTGRGKNKFGKWSLKKGIYDPEKHALSATRVYDPPDVSLAVLASEELADEDDEDDEDYDDAKKKNDDDDDDIEEEEEEEDLSTSKKENLKFVRLRGSFQEKEGEIVWKGVWADAGMELSNPNNLAFEYAGKREGKSLSLEGYFEWRSPETNKVERVSEPMTLTITDETQVKGDGSNSFGAFSLRGTLQKDVLSCRKKYKKRPVADDSEDDMEDVDEDEIKQEVAELAEEAAEVNRSSVIRRDGDDQRTKRRRAAGDDLKAKRYVSSRKC